MLQKCDTSHSNDDEIVSFANWYTLGSAMLLEAILEQKNKKIPPKKSRPSTFNLENTFLEKVLMKYGIYTELGGLYTVAIYNFKHSLELKSKRLLTHCDIGYGRIHNLFQLAKKIEDNINLNLIKKVRGDLLEHGYDCYTKEIDNILKISEEEQIKALQSLIELLKVFHNYLKIEDEMNDAFRFSDSDARGEKILEIFKTKDEQMENLETAIQKSIESQWVFRMFRIHKLINEHKNEHFKN